MKKSVIVLVLVAAILIGCASTPKIGAMTDKEWKLAEVWVNNVNTGFDRGTLAREGFGESFTIFFDEKNVSGVGAPNRYSAPYATGSDQAILIMVMRSTMMASLFEPEKLREHDYFIYLQNANKWNIVNNRLEIYSKNEAGRDVRLVFTL